MHSKSKRMMLSSSVYRTLLSVPNNIIIVELLLLCFCCFTGSSYAILVEEQSQCIATTTTTVNDANANSSSSSSSSSSSTSSLIQNIYSDRGRWSRFTVSCLGSSSFPEVRGSASSGSPMQLYTTNIRASEIDCGAIFAGNCCLVEVNSGAVECKSNQRAAICMGYSNSDNPIEITCSSSNDDSTGVGTSTSTNSGSVLSVITQEGFVISATDGHMFFVSDDDDDDESTTASSLGFDDDGSIRTPTGISIQVLITRSNDLLASYDHCGCWDNYEYMSNCLGQLDSTICQKPTIAPTTAIPTTALPTTTLSPTSLSPTTAFPTTTFPTTATPTTSMPITATPTSAQPTTIEPTVVGIPTSTTTIDEKPTQDVIVSSTADKSSAADDAVFRAAKIVGAVLVVIVSVFGSGLSFG